MNQVWDQDGKRRVVTILKIEPGIVVQVKTTDKDGYNSIVVGFGSQKESRLNQPQIKYYKKQGIKNFPKMTREIKVDNPENYKIGDTLSADQIFSIGDIVNAQGTTKGRGFAGVIKRWGFGGGPRTHGQSDRERAPGSIGQGTDPGRVHKGKKMPGHYGNQTKTISSLIIANITENEIWVTGPVPGSINSTIVLTKTGEKKFPGLAGLEEDKKEAVTEEKIEAKDVKEEKGVETPEEKVNTESVEGEEK